MKKFISYLVIFLLAFALFFFLLKLFKGKDSFIWGVGFNPFATYHENDEAVESALNLADDSGVSLLRMGIIHDDKPDQLEIMDRIISLAKKHRKKLFVVLENKFDDITSPNRYQLGFDYGKKIAGYFKGRIPYYQMGNELAAYALKSNAGGKTIDDYDPVKYRQVSEYLKGMSSGIRAGDPKAKRVVNGHHTHYGFWIEAQKDGLDFDIIGWDWFHDSAPVPDFFAYDIDGVPTDMTTVLGQMGKPIWITEAGVVAGKVGEKTAADYLGEMAKKVYQSGKVEAIFPMMLTDQAHQENDPNYRSGLVSLVKLGPRSFKYGEKRLTFEAYKSAIANSKR